MSAAVLPRSLERRMRAAATLHKPRQVSTLERRVARDRSRIRTLLAQVDTAFGSGQMEQAREHIQEAHGIAAALNTWEGGYSQHGVQLATAVFRHWCDLHAALLAQEATP